MGNIFFDPRCNVPIFQQTDSTVVENCGRRTGYILAALFSFVSFLFLVSSLWSTYKDTVLSFDEKWGHVIFTVGWFIIIQIVLWFALPAVTGFLSSYSWKGFQAQLEQLQLQGYSHKEALDQIQSYQQSQLQANATQSAGLNISAAIRSRNTR